MRRRRPLLEALPEPPARLLSSCVEDWITDADRAHAEREVDLTSYSPGMEREAAVREMLWVHARVRWFHKRTVWLDEHDIPRGREHEVIPTRWPQWSKGRPNHERSPL